MAKKSSTNTRSISPAAVPPSSSSPYKTQSSATSSQSYTTSTSTSKGSTAVPTKSPSKPNSSSKSSSSKDSGKKTQDIGHITGSIVNRYVDETPQRVKIIDAFMGFLVLLGGVQFLYVVVVGNYVCYSSFSHCCLDPVLTIVSLSTPSSPDSLLQSASSFLQRHYAYKRIQKIRGGTSRASAMSGRLRTLCLGV